MSMNSRLPVLEELQGHIEILEEEGHDVLETLKIILDESFDCEVIEKLKFEELEKEVAAYKALMTPIKPNLIKSYDFKTTGICPICGSSLMKIYHKNNCGECAHALDWESEEINDKT